MRRFGWAAIVFAACAAHAQDSFRMDQPLDSPEKVRGVVASLGNSVNGLRVCLGSDQTVGALRASVESELARTGIQGAPTPLQVLIAMSQRHPCPFSPYARAELRAAEPPDIEGTWLMPESSMKLFLPPRSPAWQQEQAVPPLKCEVVAFLPRGESRTAELRGPAVACPSTAAAFSMATRLPQVVSWDMPSPGKIVLTRTDVPGHVEEWEAFVVKAPFEFAGVAFKPGDLVEYARKHPRIEQPFAYRFRHLQRLP